MTTSKKTTAKKATTKKATAKKETDFPKAYVRLRTILDGLEIGALRYCLKDNSTKKRIDRALEIEALLAPIIAKLKDKTMLPAGCGDGYYDCGGVCVPYQCPITSKY